MPTMLTSHLSKEILTLIGSGMTFYSYFIYIRGIFKNETKPHAFSWFVWASLTGIAFAAQLSQNAGPGAWITGVTALGSFIIFFCALRVTDKDIAVSDWIAFASAIVAIIIWPITKQPLWSVILVSLIDALAFYPTFRKSWMKPHQEVATSYVLSGTKFAVSILALQAFSVTTCLYPASLVFMNAVFVIMLIIRRKKLKEALTRPSLRSGQPLPTGEVNPVQSLSVEMDAAQ